MPIASIDVVFYQKYTVYRKVPMLVTRSARLLAIDGGYIHVCSVLALRPPRSLKWLPVDHAYITEGESLRECQDVLVPPEERRHVPAIQQE